MKTKINTVSTHKPHFTLAQSRAKKFFSQRFAHYQAVNIDNDVYDHFPDHYDLDNTYNVVAFPIDLAFDFWGVRFDCISFDPRENDYSKDRCASFYFVEYRHLSK